LEVVEGARGVEGEPAVDIERFRNAAGDAIPIFNLLALKRWKRLLVLTTKQLWWCSLSSGLHLQLDIEASSLL